MVLLDTRGGEPRVLLGRRNSALAFLPDKYAFPGGRLETDDRLMPAHGVLPKASLRRLALRRARNFSKPESFALAAIRETFEETGLLLGAKAMAADLEPVPKGWRAFVAEGFAPNLAPLHFIGRAITPPAFARRFDTSFFAADFSHVARQIDGCVTPDSELVELLWLPLAQAAKLDIPGITAMMLAELEVQIAAGFREDRPVPFFYERSRRWIRDDL